MRHRRPLIGAIKHIRRRSILWGTRHLLQRHPTGTSSLGTVDSRCWNHLICCIRNSHNIGCIHRNRFRSRHIMWFFGPIIIFACVRPHRYFLTMGIFLRTWHLVWQQWYLACAHINILVLLEKILFFQSETWYGLLSIHETRWQPLWPINVPGAFFCSLFSVTFGPKIAVFFAGGGLNIMLYEDQKYSNQVKNPKNYFLANIFPMKVQSIPRTKVVIIWSTEYQYFGWNSPYLWSLLNPSS